MSQLWNRTKVFLFQPLSTTQHQQAPGRQLDCVAWKCSRWQTSIAFKKHRLNSLKKQCWPHFPLCLPLHDEKWNSTQSSSTSTKVHPHLSWLLRSFLLQEIPSASLAANYYVLATLQTHTIYTQLCTHPRDTNHEGIYNSIGATQKESAQSLQNIYVCIYILYVMIYIYVLKKRQGQSKTQEGVLTQPPKVGDLKLCQISQGSKCLFFHRNTKNVETCGFEYPFSNTKQRRVMGDYRTRKQSSENNSLDCRPPRLPHNAEHPGLNERTTQMTNSS